MNLIHILEAREVEKHFKSWIKHCPMEPNRIYLIFKYSGNFLASENCIKASAFGFWNNSSSEKPISLQTNEFALDNSEEKLKSIYDIDHLTTMTWMKKFGMI